MTTDIAAAAAAAPVTGLPEEKSSWVATPRHLAELMLANPGNIDYPDADPRSGWRLCGFIDGAPTKAARALNRAKLSSDAMRVRTKDGDDPTRGVLAPFRLTPDENGRIGMFQASVSGNPRHRHMRAHDLELHCRYLTPDQADQVRARLSAIKAADVRRVSHRSVVKPDETGEARARRTITSAAQRQARARRKNKESTS